MNQQSPKTLLFFGPQGAGKGTQKSLMIERLKSTTDRDVISLELGDFFRTMMTEEGHTQGLIQDIQATGKLQPDFLAIYAVVDKMISSYTGQEHLMLDGFPRNAFQLTVLQQVLDFYGLELDVIAISLSEEESVKRLSLRGRADDTEEAIKERLGWHNAETEPLLEYFAKHPEQYRIHRIYGEGTIEEVEQAIITSLNL